MSQFKKYMEIESQREDDGLCGPGRLSVFGVELPLWLSNLPRKFGLTPACTKHDNGYLMIRYHALQAYQNTRNRTAVEKSLDHPYWKKLVRKEDEKFKKRMRGIGEQHSGLKKFLYRQYESLLFRTVEQFGWEVWKRSTLREWEYMMSL